MSFFSFKTKARNVPHHPSNNTEKEHSHLPEGKRLLKPRLPTPPPEQELPVHEPIPCVPQRSPQDLRVKLPQSFVVRFLGTRPTDGVWGVQHTRKPVDALVAWAKAADPDDLALYNLAVSAEEISLKRLTPRRPSDTGKGLDFADIPIERITYGLQDCNYPRIFAMICVRSRTVQEMPFECLVFHCDSRVQAREMACCLSQAFKIYGDSVKAANFRQNLDDEEQSTIPVASSRSSTTSTSFVVESDA